MAARRVPVKEGPPRSAGQVRVAPVDEGEDHGMKIQALWRQAVLVPERAVLVGDLGEDAGLDQGLEALAEDRPGDAETPLEVVEPAHAQEGVAQDEERPAVAHHGDRPRQGAGLRLTWAPGRGAGLGLRGAD